MLTGSSGGFTQGRTLVEATVAGIRFPAPAPALKLGMESLTLDVTGRHVTNCAVPCYFVACGLVPGADPPGTYKPCAQARVGAGQLAGGSEPRGTPAVCDARRGCGVRSDAEPGRLANRERHLRAGAALFGAQSAIAGRCLPIDCRRLRTGRRNRCWRCRFSKASTLPPVRSMTGRDSCSILKGSIEKTCE